MKLIRLLPFMDNEEVKDLALQIINEDIQGVKLVVTFPFLSRTDLEEIVDILIEKNENKRILTSLPFISKEKVEYIHKLVQDGKLQGFKEDYLLPFLGKSAIKDMVQRYIKEAKENPPKETSQDDETNDQVFASVDEKDL